MKSYTFRWLVLLVLLVSLFSAGLSPAHAATVPSGFVDSAFGGGLGSVTAMAFAPDGRLFVLQQTGQVRVIKNGTLLGTNFTAITVDSSGERGLLGIAFDPNFVTNQYIYLYYTVPTGSPHNRIIRITASGDVAVAGSELILVDLDDLSATDHNGGAMHFRADGKLYVAVGENENPANAQSMSSRLGKILRYNTDGSIPTDNPFYNTATGANRAIWALGLRNPYTFAVQPTTDRMFINDVGYDTWEEIDEATAGANYGWPLAEGPTTNTSFKTPYYYYNHSTGTPTGCAITGGSFYNPATVQFPASYIGKYFFADYCSGWIYYIDPTLAAPTNGSPTAIQTPISFATGASSPVDVQVGPDGALYYLQFGGGVRRITYPAGQIAPTISQHPSNVTVSVGEQATFTASANGTTPLSYQWQKNTVNIPGATSSSYTTPATVIGDNGAQYRCVVTNAFGTANSNSATLTVTTRTHPTVNITSPTNHVLFSGGQQFNYSGTATDTVDGTLPASAYSWLIELHHNAHTHPFLGPIPNTTSGNFTIPTNGHTETTIFYRINLTVTNTAGLSSTTYVDLDPKLINITVNAERYPGIAATGTTVTVDGQPVTAPHTFQSVAGVERTIGTNAVQYANGHWYGFSSWSDSGAATHVITPANTITYTLRYVGRVPGLGIYRNGVFYLRNTFSNGGPDSVFAFGQSGWTPIAGDWNSDGIDSIGVYNPGTSVFYLRNSNSAGAADFVFAFGNPNDTPIAGRWDSTMTNSGVGVYRQSNGLIYLKRTLAGGFSDHWMVFGSPGDKPIAGDWDGTGFDSPGILRPSNNSFYLTDTVDGVVNSDYNFVPSPNLGAGLPIAGNWGTDTIVDRAGAFFQGHFYYSFDVSNTNALDIVYGTTGDQPIIGYWTTPSAPAPLQQPPILVLPVNGNPSSANSDSGANTD